MVIQAPGGRADRMIGDAAWKGPATVGAALTLALVLSSCGSTSDRSATREEADGITAQEAHRNCLDAGSERYCFDPASVYWPAERDDSPQSIAVIFPGHVNEDIDCRLPVEESSRQLIVQAYFRTDARGVLADSVSYADRFTVQDEAPSFLGLQCRRLRPDAGIYYRGMFCVDSNAKQEPLTMIECTGDDVPVPGCRQTLLAGNVKMALTYPKPCIGDWVHFRSAMDEILRRAREKGGG